MLADELDYVVGVDTHRDEHMLAVVAAPAGAVVAQRSVRANARGYAEALRFAERARARRRVSGRSRAPAATAPGSPATSAGRGETVLEIGRGPRDERRLRGKDDPLDAVRAAGQRSRARRSRLPRRGERREALRLLLVARRSAVDVRRRSAHTTAQRDRDGPRPAPPRATQPARVDGCSSAAADFRRSSSAPPTSSPRRLVLRSLARRIEAATAEAAELEREILSHVRALAPRLLDEPGVGPIVAAQRDRRLVTPGPLPLRSRLRPTRRRRARSPPPAARRAGIDSAAAATANSTAPCTPSSSTAASTTQRPGPTSTDALAEGKTRREATRLLKRYLARHLYRILQQTEPLMA